MMLETFFEKFDLFAGAHNAVAKMRALVLELAVRGSLGTQDPSDEPARELLESLRSKRAKLMAERKIRTRDLPPVKSDEETFELPRSWTWARLAEVGHELGQKIPNKRFTYIDVGSINSAKGRISDCVEQLEPSEAPSRARKLVLRGTVIYSMVRPYLLNTAIVEHDYAYEPIASTAFAILHPFSGIDSGYLFYWLRSASFTVYAQMSMKGATYPAINDEKFYSGVIPLPPLAEQKRIVAKVAELMTLCDRLEAQQQEQDTRHAVLARASLIRFADAPTPSNLNLLFHKSYDIAPADLRKTILTLAVQGKLVPQDPKDESARSLIERVSRHKQILLRTKQIRQGKVSRPDATSRLPQLPVSWERASIDALCFKVTDGTHFTPRYVNSGVRFVSAKDIAGGLLVFDRCKFITKEEHEKLYRRCNPERHDILISKSGSIGTVALIEDRGEFSLFESLALLKFDQENLFPHFLVYALRHACASLTAGHIRGVGVKHLHLDILRGIELAIPPLAEQRRIVAKVDQLMALVDALDAQLATARTAAANLLDALVVELTSKA